MLSKLCIPGLWQLEEADMGGKVQTKKTTADDEKVRREKTDSLTGIWSRSAAEEQINLVIQGGGSFFICDIDHFRRINEQHGHLAGDECLRQVAETLGYMVRRNDILGRFGGDEFVIFMPGCGEAEQAREISQRIENRFRTDRKRESRGIALTVTVVYTVWQKGDNCGAMFARAAGLLEEHRKKTCAESGRQNRDGDIYWKDARRIREDLIEQIHKPGAYCRDYETFKSIYRFLERGLIRSGQHACVILITLVDEEGKCLLPHQKDALMEHLGENIREMLRIGDVYTRYTSSQYLVLVIDTTEGQADKIADRIKDKFRKGSGDKELLVHYCYALQPAEVKALEAIESFPAARMQGVVSQ